MRDAEASRELLARAVALPPLFHSSLGTAVATQIATAALGLAGLGEWRLWLLVTGVVAFVLVAGIHMARFRQLNGVWLGGLASRVMGGTATAASTSYALALAAATWASWNGSGGPAASP